MASHGSACARALYNVFVKSALAPTTSPASRQLPRRLPQPPRPHRTLRYFGTTLTRLKVPPSPNLKAVRPSQLRDAEIPARRMRLVDQDGSLGPVVTRYSALRDIPPTDRLICVSKVPRYVAPSAPEYDELYRNYDYVVEQYNKQQERLRRLGQGGEDKTADALTPIEGEGGQEEAEDTKAALRAPAILIRDGPSVMYIRLPSGEEWIPVCKRENKAEASAKVREAAAAKKEAKKLAPEGIKIIELNWAIDVNNDLMHRLKKLKEFLEGRRRVEVVVAPKRRGKKATAKEAEGVLKKVREVVGEIEGAKEVRPMQGKVGEVVRMLFEGKRGKDD